MALGQKTLAWTEVKPGTEKDAAWKTYFRNLGWAPAVVDSGKPYTMPVEWPEHLPHDWEPMAPRRVAPVVTVEVPLRPGRRANLLVPMDAPRYAEMVERAKTADPADWEWHPRGIIR